MDLLSKRPFSASSSSTAAPAAGRRRGRGWQRWIARALLVAFIAFVLGMLVWQARQVAWASVWQTLRAYPAEVLLSAAAFAACGHLLYSGFDLLGRRYTGHHLPTLPTMGVTFTSYAFNLNFGAIIGGAAMRFRLYSRLDLEIGTIARVMVLSMWTNWLGYLLLAGLFLWWLPLMPPESWPLDPAALHVLGALLVSVALGYVLVCVIWRGHSWHVAWRGHDHEAHWPTPRMALLQLALGSGTWLSMSAVLYVLLQGQVDFADVVLTLLVGVVSGLVARVPAGLGVQEAVFVMMLSSQVPRNELLAAMLSYRAVYYWAPLALAALAYLSMEARAKRLAEQTDFEKRS
jgi:uncharacterized membrane protein YbhN (UPF0104 family)